jgi:hypothetical protein
LPAVTLLFLLCDGDVARTADDGRFGLGWVAAQAARAWLVAGLLVAASLCGAEGQALAQQGNTGAVATALLGSVPQVICLAVIARLAAALILSLPAGLPSGGACRGWPSGG